MRPGGATILVVEDEDALVDTIRYALEREGYAISQAPDGRTALERFRADRPALVILDLMLPGLSGLDVCRAIRSESEVPIVMVTAKDAEADKVAGLELGADDYVTKPFSVRELVSRVRAHLRRAEMNAPFPDGGALTAGPVELDPGRHEVRVRGAVSPFPRRSSRSSRCSSERRGACRPGST
jgi:two-component system response regulator RegX3